MLILLLFKELRFAAYKIFTHDAVLGLAFFYCFMLAYRCWRGEEWYQALVLALGFATLVLLKQTGIALLPLAFAFYVANRLLFSGRHARRAEWLQMLVAVLVPALLWGGFIGFASGFSERVLVLEETARQGYSSVTLSAATQIFSGEAASFYSYLGEIWEIFADALRFRPLLHFFNASYVPIIVCAAGAIFAMACAADRTHSRRIALAGLFILLSGIAYAALMYALYIFAFPQFRARELGSYERYASTFALAAMLSALFVYYDAKLWKKHVALYYTGLLAIALHTFSMPARVEDLRVVKSWSIGNMQAESTAGEISTVLPEDARVCVFYWDNNRFIFQRLRFHLHPRHLTSGKETVGERETFTSTEFRECLDGSDWFYLNVLDRKFLERFAELFANPGQLKGHTLYRIRSTGGLYHLEEKLYSDGYDRGLMETALAVTLRAGKVGAARKLLEEGGADVNAGNHQGRTVLMEVSQYGVTWAVRLLSQYASDLDAVDEHGFPALWFALAGNHYVAAQILLDNGADANAALLPAVLANHLDALDFLFWYGKADANILDVNWMTPLMLAAQLGHTEAASFLLKHGASVQMHRKDGATALSLAELGGHTAIAQTLRTAGAKQ